MCTGLLNSNTLPEFPTAPKGVATAYKIRQQPNCTDFSSVQDMETMLACIVGFWGSANSNMLIKILREQKELPYQPNLHKKHIFKFCTQYSDTFCVYDRVSGL